MRPQAFAESMRCVTLLSILLVSQAAPAGWSDVMVYVGNHTLGDPPGSTFSQEMQDIAVLRVGGCQRGAFFVDIAAHTAGADEDRNRGLFRRTSRSPAATPCSRMKRFSILSNCSLGTKRHRKTTKRVLTS